MNSPRSEPSVDQTGSYGTLICTLVDRRSSVPFADARISCVVAPGKLVQVDADSRGEFRADVPQGVYELVISARGELALILRGIGVLAGHTQYMTRAFIPGEEDPSEGDPSSAIGGYLVDRLNHPVVDAAVTAVTVKGRTVYTAQTDKYGAFILHGVGPGQYDVSVRTATNTLSNERINVPAERVFVRHDLKLMMTA